MEAVRAIAREGGGLTARAVARRIGYTPGTLYTLFENLDEIILRVNGGTLDELFGEMKRVIGRAPLAADALAEVYLGFAQKEPELWKLVFEFSLPAGVACPEWYQKVEKAITPLTAGRPELARQTTRVLWAGLHGIAILSAQQSLSTAGTASMEELTHALIYNYLAGIA